MRKTQSEDPNMSWSTRLPTTHFRSILALVLGMGLTLLPPLALAETEVPTLDGEGTVTTDVTGADIDSEIVATPVPHDGGGVITTRTGPSVPAVTSPTHQEPGALAPLAGGPSFTITVSCTVNGMGTLIITNVGADMTVPFVRRLSLNGTPVNTGTFQVNTGQGITSRTSGLFGTLTQDVLDTTNTVVASSSTFCPALLPREPPRFTVSASCDAQGRGDLIITHLAGSVIFPFSRRLTNNGTLLAQDRIALGVGESQRTRTSGFFGTLTMDVIDVSNVVFASGSTFCHPALPPGPPSFVVGANCSLDGDGTATITDVGGNMTVPFTWHLKRNGTLTSQSSFRIDTGQSTNVHTSGVSGTLTVDVLDTSNAVVASGSMFCPPPPPPTPPSLTLSASCAADATGLITIADVGGRMPVPFTRRLSRNGTPIATGAFQLNAGQSTSLHTSGVFGTLGLDVLDASKAVIASATMLCPSPSVVPVPTLVGLTQAAATDAITGAGLVIGSVTTAHSATVPLGRVISQSQVAGADAAVGSAVSLVLSSDALSGDLNGDGVVNCADLAIVKAAIGKRSGEAGFDARADTNHDGVVNVIDLTTVAHAAPAGTVCKQM